MYLRLVASYSISYVMKLKKIIRLWPSPRSVIRRCKSKIVMIILVGTAESVIHRLRMLLVSKDFSKIKSIIKLIMEQHIEKGLADIDPKGLLGPKEIEKPEEATLRKLQSLVAGFSQERQKQLQLDLENLDGVQEPITDNEESNKNWFGSVLPQLDNEILNSRQNSSKP